MKELFEFFGQIGALSLVNKLADFHGLLAMISLILFGAAIVLFFVALKISSALRWLGAVLFALFFDLVLLDIAGLVIYISYRAPGGPRSILRASESTAWLHTTVFEHKEFLAFAPPILILCALYIVRTLKNASFTEQSLKWPRISIIVSIILSLIFVLVVAAEAVLVTKTAPL